MAGNPVSWLLALYIVASFQAQDNGAKEMFPEFRIKQYTGWKKLDKISNLCNKKRIEIPFATFSCQKYNKLT